MLIAIVSSSAFSVFADGNDSNDYLRDKNYSYAYVLTGNNTDSLPREYVYNVKKGNSFYNYSSCFFVNDINLSNFKNPVIRKWEFGSGMTQPYIDPSATILSLGTRHIGFTTPEGTTITAMPRMDGLRVGHTSKIYSNAVITIGELPSNKEDIKVSDFSMQLVKGEQTKNGILAVASGDNPWKDAEVRLNASSLSQLDQAYFVVKMAREIIPAYDLEDGGEQGRYVCRAITPSGEISPYCVGYSDNGVYTFVYFMLPANTSQIILRWRFPEGSEGFVSTGSSTTNTNFVQYALQPGYHTVPELSFDPNYLTAKYPDFKSSDAIKVPRGFKPQTTFDFNRDGVKEWLGYGYYGNYNYGDNYGDYNYGNGLVKFNQNLSYASLYKVEFSDALGFLANGSNTLGYNKSSIFSVDSDFKHKSLFNSDKARFAIVDFDNDGKSDFINLTDNSVVTFRPDGNAAVQNLKTLTMDEYLGIVPPGPNPLGSGLSVIGDSKCPPAVFASYLQTDINGDGYPDFVDAATGNYYMNLGDGRFVTDSFSGKLMFRDFDGDGINDFIFYDSETKTISVTLQRIGEDAVTRTLFKGYNCGEDIWLRDFDKDGDIDILIPFQPKDNDGMSFLVMFENDGSGSFKKKEYMIDGTVNFRKCVDWNSDGNYEVLTDMEYDEGNYSHAVMKMASYTINGLTVNTTPEYIFNDRKDAMSNCRSTLPLSDVVDFDNSGQPRFVFNEGYLITPSTTLNTRPSQPTAPSISFDESTGELTVTWQRGSDKETAAADITYDLRIGTFPDGDDLMRVAATPDGKRLDVLRGNCGYDLKRKFSTQSWPMGDIYISLQAVDDSGLGSVFSQPTVFKNSQLPAQFVVEAPTNVAVYEEINIKAVSDVGNLTVKWNAEGGEIISSSAAEAVVRFTTPGMHTVTMTVSDANGNTKTVNRTIEIFPIRFERKYGTQPYVSLALDLDLDGHPEVFDDDKNCFFEGDNDGNYTKINRLFNTKSYSDPIAVDINRDGLPDIIHTKGHLINDGDKYMSDATPDGYKNIAYLTHLADLDNDGLLDVIMKSDAKLMKNAGNYTDFIEIENSGLSTYDLYYKLDFFDFNNDGLMDIYTGHSYYFENLGNFRFIKHELQKEIDGKEISYNLVGDFDGNGKADFLCASYDDGAEYFILWDNGERTNLGKFEKYSNKLFYNPNFDFDNNGCMDLAVVFRNTSTGESAVTMVLFNADHTYTMVEAPNLWLWECRPYTRTDGKPGLADAILHSRPNEKPSAPRALKTTIKDGRLLISWDAATDKETPGAGLRYNISVKRKGAEGENAYVISPMNGGVNNVSVNNDARLISATQFPIPLIALSKGEYEIKVQAVDGRMTPGDFSSTVTVRIESAGYDAPSETMVGETVAITFNADVKIADVNFGADAQLHSTVGQTAYVSWSSEGPKTVTAPGLEFTITVHPALDASFYLPEQVAGGAMVYIPADKAFEHSWKLSGYRRSFATWEYMGEPVAERIDDNTVAIRFNYKAGYSSFRLTHTVTASYGTAVYEGETSVTGTYQPQIGIVDIDDATGRYCIRSLSLGTDETEFMVYRETETYNEYELIGTMSGDDTFIDMESVPTQHTSRYAVKARFTYGESLMGKPHQPIHAMISKGINGEWNITWSKYEGRNAATYRILRGDSKSNLQCIGEVSGNNTSFTDYDPSATTSYYAVETLISRPAAAPSSVSTRANDGMHWRSRSNTVSTEDTGIEDAVIDDNKPVDIYTVSGICIKRNATNADIEKLSPGVYIVGRRKVTILSK